MCLAYLSSFIVIKARVVHGVHGAILQIFLCKSFLVSVLLRIFANNPEISVSKFMMKLLNVKIFHYV